MTSSDWNPTQYERFAAERAQPFWDLIDLIDDGSVRSMVDLGCGTGALTVAAVERLDVEVALGVDNSPAMLAETPASARTAFEHGDIGTWTADRTYDLVLANASLQWVPDHPQVLARWVSALPPDGQIAVQVPCNGDHPSHLASVAVAQREPFRSAFGGWPPSDPVTSNVLTPEQYSALLFELGVERPHVRMQVYPHVFDSSADVVEWTKGTSLTRFFKQLPSELHEPFVAAYRDELLSQVGLHAPYLYTFKRILMSGRLTRG